MNRMIRILSALTLLVPLAACGGQQGAETEETEEPAVTEEAVIEETAEPEETKEEGKALIAYFSRADENYNVGVIEEGNTYKVAKEIAAQTGCDLFEIRTVNGYPQSYDECIAIAQKEQDENARPELAETIDLSEYDEIYLGSPVWWGDYPMAVYTFLESNDFAGKTIHPFNTHEGSGSAGFEAKLKRACPDAEVTEILSIQGAEAQNDPDRVKQAVADWLK